MALKEQRINVRLWVKASTPEDAVKVAENRLKIAEWFCEDMPVVLGDGYPEGSLLYYKVEAMAQPPVLVPQIQG